MPLTVSHVKSATTPDVSSAEIRPSDWNSAHAVSFVAASNELVKYIGANNASISSGALLFSNSNGVSFGLNGSTITASVNAQGTQSVQTQGIQSVSAGGSQQTAGGLVFSNSNGLSFGMNNGTITGSYSTAAQSNQQVNLYAVGNTTGVSSVSSADARSISLQGTGGISLGWSNGSLVISGSTGGGGGAGSYNILAAGTQTAQTATTVQFADSNGISFGMSGSAQITASHNALTSQSAQAFSAANGVSPFQTLSFGDTNGVSWSISNGSIVASIGNGQPLSVYAVSNTTQNSSASVSQSALSIQGAGIASVGVSNGSVIISVPAGGGVGDGGNVLIAGTQTATSLGSVLFSNSNGISFGMSGSTRITASHNGLTTQSGQIASASNGSFAFETLGFSNANGVTFGTSAGSIISASVSQSNQTLGIFGVSNTTQGSSGTIDARSLSIQGAGIASIGYSNGSVIISVPSGGGAGDGGNIIAAGTQTATTLGTVQFSNANGISFGLAGSKTLTASHNAITTGALSDHSHGNPFLALTNLSGTTNSNSAGFSLSLAASNQTVGIFASSNTLVASSTTIDARSLSIRAIGAISAGISGGQLILSVGAGAQSVQSLGIYGASNTTGASSSSTFDARSLSFQGLGVISVGMSGGSVQISAPDAVDFTQLSVGFSTGGNTLGTTGLATGQLVLAGGANITLSGSTNGGSMTISVVGGAGGGGGGGVGISAGTQSVSTGTVVFSNSNNVSFGLSGSSRLTASFSQSAQSIGVFGVGNTTQNSSSTLDARTLSFNGQGAMTVGFSNGSIQLSAPVASLISGTGALSISSNGSTVSIGVPNLSLYASSQTTGQSSSSSFALGSLSIRGMGGISVGLSAGELILSGGAGGGGGGGAGLSAGTQSVSTGTVVFSNSNGVTFGMSGSSQITASVAAQSAQSIGIYGSSQTIGQSSSSTVDARSLSVVGQGNISAGLSAGSLIIAGTQSNQAFSAPGGSSAFQTLVFANSFGVSFSNSGGSVMASVASSLTNINVSAGTTSGNLSALVFSNSNGVSFGLNGSTLTASAAGGGGGVTPVISAANGSYSFTTLSLSNANGVSFGTSAGSAITASVAAQTNQTMGLFATGNTTQNSSTVLDARSITFNAAGAMSAGFSNGSMQLSVPATSSLSATGQVSISVNGSTISIGVPSPGSHSFILPYGGASTATSAVGHGSIFVQPIPQLVGNVLVSRFDQLASFTVSATTNGSHSGTLSVFAGVYTLNGSTLSLASSGSQSYTWTITSSAGSGSVQGIRRLSVPLAMTGLAGADYWVAFMSQTASAGSNAVGISNVRVVGISAQVVGLIGEASSNTKQLVPGMGLWSTTSAAMPASIGISDIRGIGSGVANNALPVYFNAVNMTA